MSHRQTIFLLFYPVAKCAIEDSDKSVDDMEDVTMNVAGGVQKHFLNHSLTYRRARTFQRDERH
jgi:hypothetical protein